jgi:hypothetical protein
MITTTMLYIACSLLCLSVLCQRVDGWLLYLAMTAHSMATMIFAAYVGSVWHMWNTFGIVP